MTINPNPDAIEAATVILMRELPAAPPAIMMIERASSMSFAAGARVFPGGRLDQDDRDIAAVLGTDAPADAAHRITAIRETIEEVGVAIGLSPLPDPALLPEIRAALAGGRLFSSLLEEFRLVPDIGALVPFARWCPPARSEVRTFDTRFYAASANHLLLGATADGTETVNLVWTSAEQALRDAEQGLVRIIFPTLCNLEKLAQLSSFDNLLSHVEQFPVELITPEVGEVDGIPALTIPDRHGYPRTWRPLAGLSRG